MVSSLVSAAILVHLALLFTLQLAVSVKTQM